VAMFADMDVGPVNISGTSGTTTRRLIRQPTPLMYKTRSTGIYSVGTDFSRYHATAGLA